MSHKSSHFQRNRWKCIVQAFNLKRSLLPRSKTVDIINQFQRIEFVDIENSLISVLVHEDVHFIPTSCGLKFDHGSNFLVVNMCRSLNLT